MILSKNVKLRVSTREEFLEVINRATESFPQNAMCDLVAKHQATMKQYHNLLLMIFHQTYQGPGFLALAGAMSQDQVIKEYLIKHAEEERTHWTWVINDLQATGYTGPDPRTQFPPEACQAYVAFNFYVAMNKPVARLAIATMLEALGASFGKKYATELCKQLKLTQNQATFFFGHGDTDVGHTREILEIIDGCELTPEEWGWMTHAADTAFKMYQRMYDEAAQ